MLSLYSFTTPASECSYLPDERSRMHYEVVGALSADEYGARMITGWRRFGFALFRPQCPSCTKCQSIRVAVNSFQPNQSQKRAWKANADVTLAIGPPHVTDEKLKLHRKYHAYQAGVKGWDLHEGYAESDYAESFVENPFPTEEWCYYVGERLIGVGYVDALSVGLSAIYFFYDPDERDRSLGTFNVLQVIASAKARGLGHIYLGYYVKGCRSLEYKANFKPNEAIDADGDWQPFR